MLSGHSLIFAEKVTLLIPLVVKPFVSERSAYIVGFTRSHDHPPDGKELMLIIFAEIMTISCPTNLLSPTHVLLWIACWRIILGIGIGGDYPMSSTITSDRAKVRKRGTLLAYVFANQGWGSFVGSLMTMIVLLIYRGAIENKGSKIDGGTSLRLLCLPFDH